MREEPAEGHGLLPSVSSGMPLSEILEPAAPQSWSSAGADVPLLTRTSLCLDALATRLENPHVRLGSDADVLSALWPAFASARSPNAQERLFPPNPHLG